MITCRRCGTPNQPGRSHCIACGATLEPDAEQGTPSPKLAGSPAPTSANPQPSGLQAVPPTKQTLLGIASPWLPPGGSPKQPPSGAAPPSTPAGEPSASGTSPSPGFQKTLMGLSATSNESRGAVPAGPGFQKTLMGLSDQAFQPAASGDGSAARDPGQSAPFAPQRTLMGIARPGIAPTGQPVEPPPSLDALPSPPPLDAPLPDAPPAESSAPERTVPPVAAAPRRTGLWVLLGFVGVAALAGAYWVTQGSGSGNVEVLGLKVLTDGDGLALRCTTCPDDAQVRLEGVRLESAASGRAEIGTARFQGGEALLRLPNPLEVGDHRLDLVLEAEGKRPWKFQVKVPVAFRARALLDAISEVPPRAEVEIMAPPGSRVTLDGTPLEAGDDAPPSSADPLPFRHPVDLAPEARGEAASSELLRKELEIAVTMAEGAVRNSVVSLQADITPLQLTGPGLRWGTPSSALIVSGQTAPEALVRSGSGRVRADAQGRFVLPVTSPATGTIDISASAEGKVTRTVTIEVTPQASAPAASSFSDLAKQLNQRVRVDGKIVEARPRPEGTAFLLEVSQGCPSAPCLVSGLYPIRLEAAQLQSSSKARPAPYAPGQPLSIVGEVSTAGETPRLRVESISSR